MPESRYEREEYLEQDDDEREVVGRRKSLIALVVMAALVIAGIFLAGRLREVSALQDCLMTHATTCNDLVEPPKPVGTR
jgi:hypothetical protein